MMAGRHIKNPRLCYVCPLRMQKRELYVPYLVFDVKVVAEMTFIVFIGKWNSYSVFTESVT